MLWIENVIVLLKFKEKHNIVLWIGNVFDLLKFKEKKNTIYSLTENQIQTAEPVTSVPNVIFFSLHFLPWNFDKWKKECHTNKGNKKKDMSKSWPRKNKAKINECVVLR